MFRNPNNFFSKFNWRKIFDEDFENRVEPMIVAIAVIVLVGAAILVFDSKETQDGYENTAAVGSLIPVSLDADRHSGPRP